MDDIPRPRLALSVREPWASALVLGQKPVENRTWAPAWLKAAQPEWVLIHASLAMAGLSHAELSDLRKLWPGMPDYFRREDWSLGKIIGAVRFACELPPTSPSLPLRALPWATGPKCWLATDSCAFPEGVGHTGALQVWRPRQQLRKLDEAWAERVHTGGA